MGFPCQKEKSCVLMFFPLFAVSHHLHRLLLITSSQWFLKCDIYNRKVELVFGLFPLGLTMFVLPHLSGSCTYVGGVNPQMGLCNQWKAINHDACPRFWKFPALPANVQITRENWSSVVFMATAFICVISALYCQLDIVARWTRNVPQPQSYLTSYQLTHFCEKFEDFDN